MCSRGAGYRKQPVESGSVGMNEMPDVAGPWQGRRADVSGGKPGGEQAALGVCPPRCMCPACNRTARAQQEVLCPLRYMCPAGSRAANAQQGMLCPPRCMCPAGSRAASGQHEGYVRLVVCVRRGTGRRLRSRRCCIRLLVWVRREVVIGDTGMYLCSQYLAVRELKWTGGLKMVAEEEKDRTKKWRKRSRQTGEDA